MNKKTPLLIAAALTLSAPAFAADAAWLADFRKADLNDSGGLSKLELDKAGSALLKPIKDNFMAIDADKDGQVTQAEYERYLAGTGEKFVTKFKKADLNGSGGLSRKELDKLKDKDFNPLKKNFDAIDADKDGHVTLDEYQAYMGASAATAAAPAGAPQAATPKDQCQPDCGVVVDVDRYKVEGEGKGIGAVAGGVAGGVLGKEVVGGAVGTVGGAAGGAYVGHQIEKKLKTKKMVKITVKLDSGEQKDFHIEGDKSPFARGERVQVKDGQLVKYAGQ